MTIEQQHWIEELKQKHYSHVRFYPWIGMDYEKGINSKKVLILGDSHYCKDEDKSQKRKHNCPKDPNHYCDLCYMDEDEKDRECHNKTLDTMKELFEGVKYRAHRVFEARTHGHLLTTSEEIKFWNRLAYYVYIQYSQANTQSQLIEGDRYVNKESFMEVYNLLQPDKIIIWGHRRLYPILKATFDGPEIMQHPNYNRAFLWRLLDTPVLFIDHPSSRFGGYKRWGDVLVPFLFD